MGGPGDQPPRRGIARLFHGEGGGCVGNCATYVVLVLLVIGVTFLLFLGMLTESSDSETSSSLYAREKLELDITYDEDCVIDELGWIEDTETLDSGLRYYYEATGIQPYIYLRAYDETLATEDDMLSYAEDWYEDNIDNEGTFLFVYFAGEDDGEDAGYMCYVSGSDIGSVMDDDAIEVFWDNVDRYWDSEEDAGQMLAEIYTETADEIMSAAVISGSAEGTGRVAAAFIAVILAAAILVVVNHLRGKSSY